MWSGVRSPASEVPGLVPGFRVLALGQVPKPGPASDRYFFLVLSAGTAPLDVSSSAR